MMGLGGDLETRGRDAHARGDYVAAVDRYEEALAAYCAGRVPTDDPGRWSVRPAYPRTLSVMSLDPVSAEEIIEVEEIHQDGSRSTPANRDERLMARTMDLARRVTAGCSDGSVQVDRLGSREALFSVASAEGETMSWKLEGDFYENCSCDAICPCTWSNLAHKATRDDYCRFALAFEVDNGNIDGVDVSGRSFVMIADTPPNMADGNWRVGIIIDDGANEEQVGKFGQVLSGELGGPPAALGPFLGEFLGIEQAPITIEHDGKSHRVKVGELVDYSGERVTIESGDQVTLTNIVAHPAGPTLGLAPVSSAQVSAFGIEYSGRDLSGFANRFSWNG